MYIKTESDIFTIDMSAKDGLKDNSVLDRLTGDIKEALGYRGSNEENILGYWGSNEENIPISRYILVSLKEMDDREWRWKDIIVFRVYNLSGHIDETIYNEDLWFITGLDNVFGYRIFAHRKGNDDITQLAGDLRNHGMGFI